MAHACGCRHASSLQQVVLKQLTRTLAELLKRGCSGESQDDHRRFLEEMDARVAAHGTPAARRVNIEMLEVRCLSL